VTRKTVHIKSTLFSFKGGVLKISIEPNKRCLDLTKCGWIPKNFECLGGLILMERYLIITVKKRVDPKADKWASFDVNLTNVAALVNRRVERYELKKLYHVHRVYEIKRRKVQKLSKFKPKTSKRLLRKYLGREKNRAKDFIHKLTTEMARRLKESGSGAIMKRLRDIKHRILKWLQKAEQEALEVER
jgi:putative transposase